MVGIILNYFQIIITLITGENHNSLNVWLVNYNCRLLSSPFLPFAVLKWMGKQTDGTQRKMVKTQIFYSIILLDLLNVLDKS